ncbi:MAG: hypothetical protein ACRDGA_07915, partial [Bacteroidota bacterium]
MRTLRTISLLSLMILMLLATQQATADVFASHVRLTQEGAAYVVRFVLSDRADSVVVKISDNSTVVRTL